MIWQIEQKREEIQMYRYRWVLKSTLLPFCYPFLPL